MDTTTNVLSILFNFYLLYLIKFYSTFGVKLYQYLLTADAFLDLCLAIATFLAQPIPLTGNGYFVYMSNGFFADRSATIDSLLIIIFCFFMHTNILWIPIQFVYRYRLLCKEKVGSAYANVSIITVSLLYSIISLAIIMDFFRVTDLQAEGQHVLELNQWPAEAAKRKFLVVHQVTNWRTILCIAHWTFTCTASIFIVIWCEKRIAHEIGQPTHSATRKMHKEFHRALLAMAICPLFTTSFPVFYFCITIALQLCPGQISVLMAIVLTSITVFNPLTTIICFRCYRQVTARLLCCDLGCMKKPEINPGFETTLVATT
ncbi:serpentine type 7TM GPCR chemoreceptor srd domain-containing protein [Ditylenchus destructor]|uniref:Serpentine type 7TM GPCR chemoreceptor srd domain-containing protein n=1 Tax=Ditylenchus destructor TaxID=166010 RepID=A0AAD4MR34_9BILA|nr:serpentine type 7TM GPCR chemoreceptor srd domain-containing protein [Ditylenchus destructor]